MKTISLHGSYFQNNFGDILLMAIISSWIKERGYSSNLPVSNDKMNSLIGADSVGYMNYLKSEGLVYGGGGYFGEPNSKKTYWAYRNYLRHILPFNLRILGKPKPYIIMGVGVGPISNKFLRNRVIQLFNKAKFASVRDNESLAYLKEYGVNNSNITVMPDIALTLNISNPFLDSQLIKNLDNSDFNIAYHLSYKLNDKITTFFLGYFKTLLKTNENARVTFIVDSTSKNKLLDALETEIKMESRFSIVRYESPNQIINLLNRMNLVITHKLHVGIVSLALNKPVLSFPLHQKTARLYRQLGIENQCQSLDKFDNIKFTEQLNSNLYQATAGNIAKVALDAMRNKDRLDAFLSQL